MERHPQKRKKSASAKPCFSSCWPCNTAKITPPGRVARLTDIHFLGICAGGLLDKFCRGYKLFCSAFDVAVLGDFSDGLQKVPFYLGKLP